MLHLDGGMVQFRMANNKTMYLRFNERGKPVPGHIADEQNPKQDTCTHFVRRLEHIVKFATEYKPKLSKKRRILQQMQLELESTKQLLKDSKAEFERHQQLLMNDFKYQELLQQGVDEELLAKLDKLDQKLLNRLQQAQIKLPPSLSVSNFVTKNNDSKSFTSVTAPTVLTPVVSQASSGSFFEAQTSLKAEASSLKQLTLEEEIHNWSINKAANEMTKTGANVKRKRHQSYLLSPRHKVTMTWPNDLDIN